MSAISLKAKEAFGVFAEDLFLDPLRHIAPLAPARVIRGRVLNLDIFTFAIALHDSSKRKPRLRFLSLDDLSGATSLAPLTVG
jgi:hypothetical protein